MKIRLRHSIILCLAVYCNSASSSMTHCEDERQIIFNCRIQKSKKVASVCLFRPGQDDQYLQYQFGALGKKELVFPRRNQVKSDQFSFSRQYSRFSGWRQYDLKFTVGRNRYHVYWAESSKTDGEPKEEIETWSAVTVLTSNGKSIELKCDDNVTHHFDSAYGYNVKEVEP